jgi:hypothetical protein
VESDEEADLDCPANITVKPVSNEQKKLIQMKISCWNMNTKTYRKKLPLDLLGKKEKYIFENCGIPNILMINKERTSALAKDLQSILALAEYSLYR